MMYCLLLINQQMRLKLSIPTETKDHELNVDELNRSNGILAVGKMYNYCI